MNELKMLLFISSHQYQCTLDAYSCVLSFVEDSKLPPCESCWHTLKAPKVRQVRLLSAYSHLTPYLVVSRVMEELSLTGLLTSEQCHKKWQNLPANL